jgi:uroporphyrin-III C-methyltransferase
MSGSARRRPASSGTVYLVGAGPGDPKLLTLRGAELLRSADVVVHDRLVSDEILHLAPSSAELVDVGKMPGLHHVPQDGINRILVEHAVAGRRVVRLKGGDPFVFGRGGEEALACARAGVEFEVVPGVTSAVAAPAAAGIPLTHRGVASGFAVVTASHAPDGDPGIPAWAARPDTIVVLMAASKLAEICASLIAVGRPADQPAAVVEWGTTPMQRTIVGTLADVADLAEDAGIGPPAALVAGDVVALAEELATVRRAVTAIALTSAPAPATRGRRRRRTAAASN